MKLAIAILGVILIIGFVYFWIQISILKTAIKESDDRNDRLNQTLTGMCDMMSDFSSRLNKHINPSINVELASRIKYINDPTAKKLWDFLGQYTYSYEDKYENSHEVIPTFRVLDALSMINQDKIEYSKE